MRELLPCVIILGLALALLRCATPMAAAQNTAEAAYGAELIKCVDDAKTLAESKACRANVDAKWNVTQKEAGK